MVWGLEVMEWMNAKACGKKNPYIDRHNASGIKVGDRVRITRAATDREDGWKNVWADSMSNDVGKSFVVDRDGGEVGFRMAGGPGIYYPYFVLEKIKSPRAKVGDWVRPAGMTSVPKKVASVHDDDVTTTHGWINHGNYEIFRQVVTPWTMKDACEALAKHGFDFETSHSKQTCVTVHEHGLHTERRHTISFETLAKPCPIGAFNWRFPDGTPCGNVSWEVVE